MFNGILFEMSRKIATGRGGAGGRADRRAALRLALRRAQSLTSTLDRGSKNGGTLARFGTPVNGLPY
jgi:hypothetical protein